MRSRFSLLAVLLALPASAGAALAPSETGRAAFGAFKSLDADLDRRLTRDELLARGSGPAMKSLFTMLDRSGDGRLSLEEMQARGNGALIARLDAYDADRDGYVTRAEWPASFDGRLFAALDRSGDGAIALADMRPEFAGWAPRPAPAQPETRPETRPETHMARRDEDPATRTWCWVPVIGAEGWQIEGPVAWGRCRVQ